MSRVTRVEGQDISSLVDLKFWLGVSSSKTYSRAKLGFTHFTFSQFGFELE